MLFREKIFDAVELIAGLSDRANNIQLAMWIEQLLAGNRLPVVGSSDSHFHDAKDRDFNKRFNIVFAKDNSTDAIMQAIREGYSVAADVPPNDEADVRFYCDKQRLVHFAHFLYENYFNQTGKLCFAEGVLMRRYAEGEDVADTLAALAPTVENFYNRFFGKTPIRDFAKKDLDFIGECRETHRTVGPITRGSQLYIIPQKRNYRNE